MSSIDSIQLSFNLGKPQIFYLKIRLTVNADVNVLTKLGPDLSRKVTASGLLLPENVKIKMVNRLGSGELNKEINLL